MSMTSTDGVGRSSRVTTTSSITPRLCVGVVTRLDRLRSASTSTSCTEDGSSSRSRRTFRSPTTETGSLYVARQSRTSAVVLCKKLLRQRRSLAIYSRTVVRQLSYVRRSYDIDTAPFAIHDTWRTSDWRKYEHRSATYLHMSYDRHHRQFY